jgi:hypothetical protein
MPPAAVVRLRTTTTRHEQGQLLELAVECGANRRTCSASPVASRCADGSDKPKLRLACRFELTDAFSALRLPPNAVATVSGPTVRHPEIVTRLQRVAFGVVSVTRYFFFMGSVPLESPVDCMPANCSS